MSPSPVDAGDHAYMLAALALAERGRGTTRPNPMVGCVVVRDGVVVGEGWHQRPGGPHAEVVALAAAGESARAATVFVSLEPCSHHGRTPPCTDALVAAGVRRVVYAAADPHPRACDGGRVLAAAGVEVIAGVLAAAAEAQNEVFLTAARLRRPHVTLKLARNAAGALHVPGRRWITGDGARIEVHRLRAEVDAVLVGSGTALADDPRLDVRHLDVARQPRPVVLDGRGRLRHDARVVRPGAVVVTAPRSPLAWRRTLIGRGVDVVEVPAAGAYGVDLTAALSALHARDVRAVLAEPGPTLATALLADGLVDRLVLHTAPDGEAVAVGALPPAGWHLRRRRQLGADVEEVYAPRSPRPGDHRAVPAAVARAS